MAAKATAELAKMNMEIMPNGQPDFEGMRNYPSLQTYKGGQQEADIMNSIFLIIKGFCESMNVKAGMTPEQIIECAGILFNDCGNYRLEDYYTMFEMAKRGKLGTVYERLDIEVISKMKDAYDSIRFVEGQKILWRKEEERRRLVEEDRQRRLSEGAIEISMNNDDWKENFKKLQKSAIEGREKIAADRDRKRHEEYDNMRNIYAKINNVPMGHIQKSLSVPDEETHKKLADEWNKTLNNRKYLKPKSNGKR